MKRLIVFYFLSLMIISSACTSQQQKESLAEQSIRSFFYNLSIGRYRDAASGYGGSYETLIAMNPSINPNDDATLWEQACKYNGFMCLQVSTVTYEGTSEDVLNFKVTFLMEDGRLFVQEACCGKNPSEQPAQTTFLVQVKKDTAGIYQVLTMPVYVP